MELRSEELASSAMQLDKADVCGRQINVGRPKGYVEPPGGPVPAASINAAQLFAASLGRRQSTVLLLENMLKAYQLHDDTERKEVWPPVHVLLKASLEIRTLWHSPFAACRGKGDAPVYSEVCGFATLEMAFLQLLEDVREECGKYGTIKGIAVPKPPAHVRTQPGRVYIR